MATAPTSLPFQDRLRQGQVLRNLYEFVPTGLTAPDGTAQVTRVEHPLVVIMSPECDLISDYEARRASPPSNIGQPQPDANLLEHIQCCKLFEEIDIRRPHGLNSAAWSFVKTNRHERYHMIAPSVLRRPDDATPLYLDFKRVLSISTAFLYQLLNAGGVELDNIINPPWIHQLIQRCYGFQARVCVPDPTDRRPSAEIQGTAVRPSGGA